MTKCTHCSHRVGARDLVVFVHGDLFHRACWRIVVSYERMEKTRALRKKSRAVIDAARAIIAKRRQTPKK